MPAVHPRHDGRGHGERMALDRRTPWTVAEKEKLMRMRTAGSSYREIAEALGRGEAATEVMYHQTRRAKEGPMQRRSGPKPKPVVDSRNGMRAFYMGRIDAERKQVLMASLAGFRV